VTEHLLFFLALAGTSALFALVEIQVEGPHGWAGKLPTWRFENRWTKLFWGGRPFTGYHLYIQLLFLLVVHLPWLLSLAPWTVRGEARVLAFLVLFWILEDFLWFVLNPAFGLRRFRAEHIWWHRPQWWGFMPRDYWVFLPVGASLYLLSVSRA